MYLLTGNGIIALVDDETTEESEDDVHHDSEEEDTKWDSSSTKRAEGGRGLKKWEEWTRRPAALI